MSVNTLVFNYVARTVKIHISGCQGGCSLTEIQCIARPIMHPDNHEAASANIPRRWINYRQCKLHRNGRIYCIPPSPENIPSDTGCQGMCRYYSSMIESFATTRLVIKIPWS